MTIVIFSGSVALDELCHLGEQLDIPKLYFVLVYFKNVERANLPLLRELVTAVSSSSHRRREYCP